MATETDGLLRNGSHTDAATATTTTYNGNKRFANLLWTILGASIVVLLIEHLTPLLSYSLFRDQETPDASSLRSKEVTSTSEPPQQQERKYKSTQFVSFSINTMGGLADRGECEGLVVDKATGTCYLGDTANITQDLDFRIRVVESVLNRLHADVFAETPKINHANSVLKIVLFPEFFARGPYGAYSTVQLLQDGLLIAMADRLRTLIHRSEFSDYLFALGTAIAAESVQHGDGATLLEQHSQETVEYFNFSPVYLGGPHERAFLVTKKYISGADFLDRVTLPDPALPDIVSHRMYDDLPPELLNLLQERNVTVVSDNLLEFDGLRVGMEICLVRSSDLRVGQNKIPRN